MKKDYENPFIGEEVMQRAHRRCVTRAVKMFSLTLASMMVVVSCMIVPIGHADDTCLQVPSEQTLAYVTGQSSGALYTEFVSQDVSDDQKSALKEQDTFVITEKTDRNGVATELLDPAAFRQTDETMYVLDEHLYVRALPDASSEVTGQLEYGTKVARIGIGSSWSQIEFVSENETTSSGYVLTSSLTSDVVATPTPTPTETPTPTPKPKKKSTPTPEPTKEATPTPEPKKEKVEIEETESTPTPTPRPSVEETVAEGTFYSVGEVNVRSGPDTSYSALRKLAYNEKVSIVAKTSNGWYKLSDGGYVKASLLSSTDFEAEPEPASATEPETKQTSSESESENSAPSESSSSSGGRNIPSPDSCNLLTYARAFLGVPYVYCGASLDGLDCSGFVMYVYAHYYGVSLPHQSASIAELGRDVTNEERVAGDVFCHDYNHDGRVDHVSLYCGSGVVIHASTSNGGIIEETIPMMDVVTVRRFI